MFFNKVFTISCAIIISVQAAPQFNQINLYNQPFNYKYNNPYNQAYYNPAYYNPGFVSITGQHFDIDPNGSYRFGYRSADGSSREEVGGIRYGGTAGEALAVQGSYSYNSPAGPLKIDYIADENGFQPNGPAVHPSIIKAVAQQVAEARANPYNSRYYDGKYDDGQYYNPNQYNRNQYPYRKFK